MVLEGHEAVKAARQVIGATNPLEAAPGLDPRRLRARGRPEHGPRVRLRRVRRARGGLFFPELLILALRSPQRRAILEQLGVAFDVAPAGRRGGDGRRPAAVAADERAPQGAGRRPRRRSCSARTRSSRSTARSSASRATRRRRARRRARWRPHARGRRRHRARARRRASSRRPSEVTERHFRALDDRPSSTGTSRTGEWRGPRRRLRDPGRAARRSSSGSTGDYLNVVGLPARAPARRSCRDVLVAACTPTRLAGLRSPAARARLGSARLARSSHGLLLATSPGSAAATWRSTSAPPTRSSTCAGAASCCPSRRVVAIDSRTGEVHAVGHRGQADARPHAGHDLRHPAAEGRRDRRLRRHRGDAAPLHPEGAPEPLGASARRRLRALRRHRASRSARSRRRACRPAPARPT